MRAQPRARSQVYAERIARRRRILNLTATMAVFISAGFGFVQVFSTPNLWWTGVVNMVGAAIYASVPLLHRFGELLPPLTFICTAYASIFMICWFVGTGSGLQFYFLVAACLIVLQLGVDRIFLAAVLAAIAASLVITLQFLVPRDTGAQPAWALSLSFVVTTCLLYTSCKWVVIAHGQLRWLRSFRYCTQLGCHGCCVCWGSRCAGAGRSSGAVKWTNRHGARHHRMPGHGPVGRC